MVHVPAKFRENTAMRVPVTVQKLYVTDKQTDRRMAFQYLPCRAFCAAGDEYTSKLWINMHRDWSLRTLRWSLGNTYLFVVAQTINVIIFAGSLPILQMKTVFYPLTRFMLLIIEDLASWYRDAEDVNVFGRIVPSILRQNNKSRVSKKCVRRFYNVAWTKGNGEAVEFTTPAIKCIHCPTVQQHSSWQSHWTVSKPLKSALIAP